MLNGPLVVLYKNDPADPSDVSSLPCEVFRSQESFDTVVAGIAHAKVIELERIDVDESRDLNVVTVFCFDSDTNLAALSLKLQTRIKEAAARSDAIHREGAGTVDERLDDLQDRQGHADI